MGFGFNFAHRIDQLAPHQIKRRLGVNNRVVERIGQNLRGPYQTGLHAFDEEQLNHSKQQRAGADKEPNFADVTHETHAAGMCGE